jgi:hypothetical protein
LFSDVMVIFVVAIRKTILCKKLPLKAASAGTPALRDVTAVWFGETGVAPLWCRSECTRSPPRPFGDTSA